LLTGSRVGLLVSAGTGSGGSAAEGIGSFEAPAAPVANCAPKAMPHHLLLDKVIHKFKQPSVTMLSV
jgi:hypothetical protein